MKKYFLLGLLMLFLLTGAVLAQDRMIIYFKDGKTQAIGLETIQKIEYQQSPAGWCETLPPMPVAANIPLIQNLPDRAFTASSFWGNDLAGHGPPNARMGSTATFSNWSAALNDQNQWLQVDLGAPSVVRAVGTKGRSRNYDQWVTSYRLSTSLDGVKWHMYQQGGVDVTFRGNSDRETEVRHTLPSEVTARYLRFHPVTWHGHITMRVEAYGIPAEGAVAAPAGIPVTLYWHMADTADLYLNGVPLRRYEPAFRTRGDEAPLPAFSAQAVLKNGDVFTVGGRRGGSYGFMLIAVDAANRVVFKTDTENWRVYLPGERADWYLPTVAAGSPQKTVQVQPQPWHPQRELNSRYNNIASSIWDVPAERFSYLTATVRLAGLPPLTETKPPATGVRLTGKDILPQPHHLLSWFPGDGNTNDIVGNKQGSLRNGASYAPGLFGQAFRLDGADDFVDLGAWNLGPVWSIEAWVNASAVPTGRRTIAGAMFDCRDWGLVLQDRELGLAIRPPGACTQTILSGVSVTPNKWYHLVGTSDGITARIFVNGEMRRSAPVEANYLGTTQGVRIGGEVCCPGNNFPGLVDEVRFYNRALTPLEIAGIYNAVRLAVGGQIP